MPDRNPTFGALLAEQLQAKERAVDWLAECIDLPAGTVAAWLAGASVPTSLTTVNAILDCLDVKDAQVRQRFLRAAGFVDDEQTASGKMPPQDNKPTADRASGVLFEGNQSVNISGDVITGGTVNKSNFYGPVSGPVHTGSGNIHIGETQREGPEMPGGTADPKEAVAKTHQPSAAPQDDKDLPAMQRPIKILFLTANPQGTDPLRADEELRAIDQALQQAEYRHFKLIPHQAVRIDDLQELLLRHRPDIVHFSGHGTARNELILQDAAGNAAPVQGAALRTLFANLKDNIRLVVFNACHTEAQARSVADLIDCVVGMGSDLTDQAAIHFATAFYRALGYGRSVQEAFQLGQSQVVLHGFDANKTLHLFGHAAAQIFFATARPTNAQGTSPINTRKPPPVPSSDAPAAPNTQHQTEIHTVDGNIHTGSGHIFQINLWQLPFNGLKAWARDFFYVDEADDHARSSWAGMTLYLLGAPMKRFSGENLLTLLVALFTAVLAIGFITPVLAWPQSDALLRFSAASRFAAASLILPLFIAFLAKPEGVDNFLTQNGAQWKILLLKLTGAWTGFGALAGTGLVIAIAWYHLWGSSLPPSARWAFALLPLFFAYVSARRIPFDRCKMFDGELRLHDADPLFLVVFALFGPLLAAVLYWGHAFLINRAVMTAVLLGLIGITVWERHRNDQSRFPDLLVIAILGLLLPLGFLLLFYFDMRPPGELPVAGTSEIALFAIVAGYFFGTTLLLSTVAVRQSTRLTIQGTVGFAVILFLLLLLLRSNIWLGRAVTIGLLVLWYAWGRQAMQRWHHLHLSVDLLGAAMVGAMMLGIYTPLPLWLNATLFLLGAGALTLWAYQKPAVALESSTKQTSTKSNALLRWGGILLLVIIGVSLLFANRPLLTQWLPAASVTTGTSVATLIAIASTGAVTPSPSSTATSVVTATPTVAPTDTALPSRASVARPAPGENRYFIVGPDLDAYHVEELLAVYGQESGGNEFDVAVVFVVDKNSDNLIVQVIFQNEAEPLDSLAALQLDNQLADVDLASMTPVNARYVGFMLEGATVRLVADTPVTVGDQLEARQFTRSGDTLPFPDGPLLVRIDSISDNGKVAAVSSVDALPPVGTLLVLADPAAGAGTAD